ncbi:MAG: hypothetical protein HGA45_40930, partial [Chloroflexales bacterium]|nr:hypothetical protein [Chloroflexales bacterium]
MGITKPEIAFALGGLAGNNAHGAGFLHAALNHVGCDLTPTMISCTSGQIYWVWQYLQARGNPPDVPADPQRVQRKFMEDIEAVHRFENINLDYAAVAISGRPNVFRPAYNLFQPLINEYTLDLWQNSLYAAVRILANPFRTFWLQEIMRAYPGRLLIPEFPKQLFDDISAAFNNEKQIGIAFNSYCPQDGVEYVYLNDAARARLSPDGAKYQPDYVSASRSFGYNPADPNSKRTIYKPITSEAVRDGLWIYEYGFTTSPGTGKDNQLVDGAYYRQIMLKELQSADVIFVARPINARWLPAHQEEGQGGTSKFGKSNGGAGGGQPGHSAAGSRSPDDLPRSYVEMQDLKTEVNFNGSYVGERAQIAIINDLVDKRNAAVEKGILPEGCSFLQDYKHLDLIEIEI